MSMSLVSSASVTNLYIESIVVGGFSVMPLVMLVLESSVEYTAGFSGGGQDMFTGQLSVGVCCVSGSFILEKPIS